MLGYIFNFGGFIFQTVVEWTTVWGKVTTLTSSVKGREFEQANVGGFPFEKHEKLPLYNLNRKARR